MNININTGEIRLTINDDENRIIAFNPNDLEFVNKFYGLIKDFEVKEKEYNEKKAKLNEVKDTDSFGIPVNFDEHMTLLNDTSEFLKAKIDFVFGEGTSKAAFGKANTIDMFEQFFEGITPFIQKTREDKIKKYTQKTKRNVMK